MDVGQAAEMIWAGAQAGTFFPEPLRGKLTLEQALQIQLAILDRKLAAGESQAGWKVGLTSAKVRARFGSEDRPFGHIMAHRAFASGVTVPSDEITNLNLEGELCFYIGETLKGPGVTPEHVRGAVAGVSAGFEINEGRSGGVADFPLAVADNLSQWGIVHGEPLRPIPGEFDFDGLTMDMALDGKTEATAIGREVIDHHYVSLAVLANTLTEYGRTLEAGQKVITGAYTKHPVAKGQHWKATFAGIGSVEATIG